MPYPIELSVTPQFASRDRVTVLFRLLLALPHFLLIGTATSLALSFRLPGFWSIASNGGLLGALASVLAIVSWFTIVLSGRHVEGIREFTRFVLRWRWRVLAYSMLLVDQYPPFGDGVYPLTVRFAEQPATRNRLTVGLRLILVIPHFVVLFFVVCVWWIQSVIAWFAILITGRYPDAFAWYAIGSLRWVARVEGYLFLMYDEYPPFRFGD